MLLRGVWLLLGVIALSNARPQPSSTLEALSYNDSPTIQSFNGSSSIASSTLHHLNGSTAHGHLSSDNEYSNARNKNGNVRIFGPEKVPLVLNNGHLTFDLCGAAACNDKILVCFESTSDTSSMDANPRRLCIPASQCGFQVDMTGGKLKFMGNTHKVDLSDFFGDGSCSSITMISPEIKISSGLYDVCTPTITGNEMVLYVESASQDCSLVVIGAHIKPNDGSNTSPSHVDSTTKDASDSSTDYMWILYVFIGIIVLVAIGAGAYYLWRRFGKNRKSQEKKKRAPPPKSVFAQAPMKEEPVESKDAEKAEVSKPVKPEKADVVEEPVEVEKKSKLSMITPIQAVEKVKKAPLPVCLTPAPKPTPTPVPVQAKKESTPKSRPRVHPHPFVGRSGSVRSAKKDSMQDHMHEEYGHMMLDPIDSLVKVHPHFTDAAPGIKAAYPRSLSFSKAEFEVILIERISVAYKKILEMDDLAKKELERAGVKFDAAGKAVLITSKAREMMRDEDTAPYVKGYLFMAEYGHYFKPTDDLIDKYSAPLLYYIAIHPGYEQLLRRAALSHMRKHLSVLRLYWSVDERNLCHYPINVLDDAYENDRVKFCADVKTDSNSSVRKANEAQGKPPRDANDQVKPKKQ